MSETANLVAPVPVLSVNTGMAESGTYRGREARSGIGKRSIGDGSVRLGFTGFEGDEQADQVNHGGPDKAVCVYSYKHYPYWESVLERELPMGAFGENLTLDGLPEDEVHIGDVYATGTVKLQVTQPRVPCWKLAMRWGLEELPLLVAQTGATGFYFRVLEPGLVSRGELTLVSRHPAGISVQEANRILHRDKGDAEGIRRLLAVDSLAAYWRETLAKRLAKLEAEG